MFDESQFLEFVHQDIGARARCANHFRQRFLRHCGDHPTKLLVEPHQVTTIYRNYPKQVGSSPYIGKQCFDDYATPLQASEFHPTWSSGFERFSYAA